MPDVMPRVYAAGERVVVEIIVNDPHDFGNIHCNLGAEVILPSIDDLRACEVTRDKARERFQFAESRQPRG